MADRGDKRDEYIFMARLAEQTERFEDMVYNCQTTSMKVEHMKKVIDLSKDLKDLGDEERNLLSIAYKNAVGQRRTAWRAITAYEIKEKSKIVKYIDVIQYYKTRVEKELDHYCNEILQLIDTTLLKKAVKTESRVFYHKMKGDYNRYISEFSAAKTQEKAILFAQQSYQTAMDLMDKDNLPKSHLLRLGVSLNYSVFLYEILSDVSTACQVAKKVFEEAAVELDEIEDEHYKDATTIMQLLRDNLTNWSGEIQEEDQQTQIFSKKN